MERGLLPPPNKRTSAEVGKLPEENLGGKGRGIGLGRGRLGDKSSGESRHVFHSLGSTVPTKAQSSVLLQFKERRRKWWHRSVTPTLNAEGTNLRPVWAIKQDPVSKSNTKII